MSRVFSHAELLAQPPCNSRASARFDRAESSCARGASNRIFAGLCVVERSSRGNAPLLGVPWPTFSRNASIDSAQRSRRAAETLARGSAMVSAAPCEFPQATALDLLREFRSSQSLRNDLARLVVARSAIAPATVAAPTAAQRRSPLMEVSPMRFSPARTHADPNMKRITAVTFERLFIFCFPHPTLSPSRCQKSCSVRR